MIDTKNRLSNKLEVLTEGDQVKVMCDFMILVDIFESLEKIAIDQKLIASRYQLRALEWSKCDSIIMDISKTLRRFAKQYGIYKEVTRND